MHKLEFYHKIFYGAFGWENCNTHFLYCYAIVVILNLKKIIKKKEKKKEEAKNIDVISQGCQWQYIYKSSESPPISTSIQQKKKKSSTDKAALPAACMPLISLWHVLKAIHPICVHVHTHILFLITYYHVNLTW